MLTSLHKALTPPQKNQMAVNLVVWGYTVDCMRRDEMFVCIEFN